MAGNSTFEEGELKAASAAIAKGHRDPENLRELLIWTTSKTTRAMVESYFQQHYHDKDLLRALVSIALEGEDAGDAPWAAANTIADFPASMLMEHKAALLELSKHDWDYLKRPALAALAKIAGNAA
jgi:hypothetical protein